MENLEKRVKTTSLSSHSAMKWVRGTGCRVQDKIRDTSYKGTFLV